MKLRKKRIALFLVMMMLCSCFSCIASSAEENPDSQQLKQQIEEIQTTKAEDSATTPEAITRTLEPIETSTEESETTPETITTTPAGICNVTLKMGYLPGYRMRPGSRIPNYNPQIKIKDSENQDVKVTFKEPTDVREQYAEYKIAVQPGTYTYEVLDQNRLEDKYKLIGGGSLDITENGQEIYLRRLNFTALCNKSLRNSLKEVLLKDNKGRSYTTGYGSTQTRINAHKGPFLRTSFVVPALAGETPYYYEMVPKDEYKDYWCSKGKAYAYPVLQEDVFSSLNLSDNYAGFVIAKKTDMEIRVPHSAELNVYHRVKFYRPLEQIDTNTPTQNGEYDVYHFKIPERTQLHYEVRQEGKVTQAKTFGDSQLATLDPITVPPLKDNPKQVIKDVKKQGYYNANLLMNVPHSKYLQLKKGNSFELSIFRSWQAIESTCGNYYVEPDYHFDVAYGDSVAVSKEGIITAKKSGVSVIHVTYDALEFEADKSELEDENGLMVYSAIFPKNTGVIVVNVDENNTTKIQSNIKQSEYDCVYFARSINGDKKDNYAEYKFKPTVESGKIETVSVQTPLTKSIGEGWTLYTPDSDGYYTIKLYEGRNIVKMEAGESVSYYVLTAAGLDVTIKNVTHPGKPLTNADKAQLSFEGLYMPFPKLAAVYNPGFPDQTWIQYNYDGARIDSNHVQYNITTDNNTLNLYLDTPGTCRLTNGRIHTTSIGDNSDGHRAITKASKISGYNDGDSNCNVDGYFCSLPDIEFSVLDAGDLGEKGKLDFCRLNGLEIVSKNPNISSNQSDVITLLKNPEGLQSYIVVDDASKRVLSLKATICNSKAKKVNLKLYKNGKEISNGEFNEEIPLGKLESNPTLIEVVVTPIDFEQGYTKTYAVKILPENYKYAENHRAYYGHNIKVDILEDKDNPTYGLLRPQNNELFEKYGWGYLSTLKNTDYIVTVPNETKQISVNSIFRDIHRVGDMRLKSETVLVNGEELNAEKTSKNCYTSASKPIALTESETLISFSREALYANGGENVEEKNNSFKITVIRAEPTTENPVILQGIPDGNAKVVVKNRKKQVMIAQADGSYLLPAGKYICYLSKKGYKTSVTEFYVTYMEEGTQTLSLNSLEALPEQSGTATVRVSGYDSTLRNKMIINIDKPTDLALQKYVDYNYGGYTVLHALIDAFQTGISKVDFTCRKGNLTPSVSIDETNHGSNAGWVCEVNGTVVDPATTLINNGDKIDFYYNADFAGMRYTWFEKNYITIKAGDAVTVKLLSTPVNNNGTDAIGVKGATIKINGTPLAEKTTNAKGELTIPSDKLTRPGKYIVTANKIDNGKNSLTYANTIVRVKKADIAETPGKMKVSFRLIGDAKHNGIEEHGKYVTWIATKKIKFNSDSVPVYDVFTRALDEAGLKYAGAEKNYVEKIKAPKAYGGYWLSEFDNGDNSGWMYTVNGDHPSFGLKEFEVTNGDSIVWHYVDDYKLETTFEGSKPLYPNRWLEADDIDPPSGGKVVDMSKGNNVKVEKNSEATVHIDTNAKTDKNGKAIASVSSKDVKTALKLSLEAVKKAEKDGKKNVEPEVQLNVKADSKATSLETSVPTIAVKELTKAKANLTVHSPIGNLVLDHSTLKEIGDAAAGKEISFQIAKIDKTAVSSGKTMALTEAQKKVVGEDPVYNISILSGDKKIKTFGNKKLSISLPYTLKSGEKAGEVSAWYLDDLGQLTKLTSKYDEKKKMVTFEINHLSCFMVGCDITGDSNNGFSDVKKGQWYYDSIMYLVDKGIVSGTTKSTFSPNANVTRAEFAQILYGMAQSQVGINGSAITADSVKVNGNGASKAFSDVQNNDWYAKAIDWAYTNGIVKGMQSADGTMNFAPNAKISRQDMAVMIQNYVEKVEKKTIAEKNAAVLFADDAGIASYAKDAVTSMQKGGVINGIKANDGTSTFAPKKNATRAEAATMITKYLQK